jgi:hypothetical protein
MSYLCERCGHTTTTKSNLLAHLRRKNPCQATKNNVDVESLINVLLPKKDKGDSPTHTCAYCDASFNNRQNRWRHMKTCKSQTKHTDVIQQLTSKVCELEKEIEKVKNIQVHNHTTINTQNNQMNININNYGNETLNHIPADIIQYCFMMKDIPSLIENIHFDKECPENKNIQLKSLKHKIINIYQDNKWIAKPADSVLNDLVNKSHTILKKHYKNNTTVVEEDMSPNEIDDVIEWLTQIWNNNEKIRKPLKTEIIAVLQNYR